MTRATTVLLLATLLGGCASWSRKSPEVHEVRNARELFNAAIVSRDLDAIAGIMAPGYVLVTGRGDVFSGSQRVLDVWAALFERDGDAVYRRTPREVRIHPGWGLAEELGDWTGRLSSDEGPARLVGCYAARWQRANDGRWLLTAEVFTTLSCDGPPLACRPPDPIP